VSSPPTTRLPWVFNPHFAHEEVVVAGGAVVVVVVVVTVVVVVGGGVVVMVVVVVVMVVVIFSPTLFSPSESGFLSSHCCLLQLL